MKISVKSRLHRFSGLRRGQGSLEYIMMLSAVSIIIVIAIALMMQLKGVALHPFIGGSGNVTSILSNEISNLSMMIRW
ncbi:MAG: class III signal peptide-containing protein [Candidatus Marsarchaeota archaeon]|jgi:hypothetical protein|nr:class III signal peptide-containing protein [Candidatus Marsarchaeota archaeon]